MRLVGWRVREASFEAIRNATSTPGRISLAGLAALAIFTSIVFAELRFTEDLLSFQERFEREGGYVAVATANETFPAWRCQQLAQREDVIAAAGLSRSNPIRLSRAPGLLFQAGRFTGSLAVWDPNTVPSEAMVSHVVLGNAAAEELGVDTGQTIGWLGSDFAVNSVLNPDQRNPEIARWLLIREPPSAQTQECWVEFAPGHLEAGIEILAASLAPAARGVEVRPWRRLDEFARDPVAELINRVQRHMWLPAGILIVWLGWLVSWFRRSEQGLYRALGTSNMTLWYMAQVESVLVIGVGLFAGFQLAVLIYSLQFGLPALDQLLVAGRNAASTALLAMTLAPLGWLLTARTSIADQIKDR